MRHRFRGGASLAIVTALLVAACGREPTSGGEPGRASLNLGRLFQTSGTTIIRDSVSQVRLTVSRVSPAPVQVLTNVVLTIPDKNNGTDSTSGDQTLTATFPLQGSDAQYELLIRAFNPGSDTLFQIGPLRFGASQIDATGAVQLAVPESEIVYVGPGSDAVKVVASPRSVNLVPGQSAQFSAQALGASNAVIARALFDWSVVSGTDIASVDNSGMVFALSKRGTARIAVSIPSALNPSDTVSVNVSLGPAQIVLVSGGSQSAPAGTQLPSPIVVKVVASDGVPVPGILVTFNSALASPGSATTDANGLAQTRWTLGNSAGAQTLGVSAANLPQLQVQATATQAVISLVSGNNQTGVVGQQLGKPVVVEVFNGTTPVSGVTVTFNVASGSGSAKPSSAVTDTTGHAQTLWTLGTTAGPQTMSVTAAGASGSIPVAATGTATPGVSIVSILPTAITTAGTSTITVQVTGAGANGAQVTFTSTGSGNTFSPVTATADTGGRARTVFSSTVPETKTITVTSSGASAQGTLPVVSPNSSATQLVKISGDNQTVHYGTLFAQAATVQALDAAGHPVAGALIDWGTSSGNVRRVTDANGMSSNSYTLPNDPVSYPTGQALTIVVSLVGTAATATFTYFAVP